MKNRQTAKSIAQPWGAWATGGIFLLIFITQTMSQTLAFIALIIYQGGLSLSDFQAIKLSRTGLCVGLGIATEVLPIFALIYYFVQKRRISLKSYLSLTPASFKVIGIWCVFIVILQFSAGLLQTLLGIPPSDFAIEAYKTAGSLPLLWISVAVLAPIVEEVVFRGFLFEGLKSSKLGPIGAILITSFIFAIIHMQYGAFEISTIFALGILLAVARWKTKSLYVPIFMHGLHNLMALAAAATQLYME